MKITNFNTRHFTFPVSLHTLFYDLVSNSSTEHNSVLTQSRSILIKQTVLISYYNYIYNIYIYDLFSIALLHTYVCNLGLHYVKQ